MTHMAADVDDDSDADVNDDLDTDMDDDLVVHDDMDADRDDHMAANVSIQAHLHLAHYNNMAYFSNQSIIISAQIMT